MKRNYLRGLGNNSPPTGLSLGNGLQEEGRNEQVLQLGVLSVGSSDVGQEDGLGISTASCFLCWTHLDDTSSSPHGSDTGVVEGPVVGLGSLSHEHETLSVRHDLGGVKGLLKVAMLSAAFDSYEPKKLTR
jgi:hypothetical protein